MGIMHGRKTVDASHEPVLDRERRHPCRHEEPTPIGTALPLGNAAIQIRVWYNDGLYSTYEAAAAGKNVGKSAVMTINLKSATEPTVLSLTDIGMAAFTVASIPSGPATRTAVQSGPWNDPATWGGTVPATGEDVVIPAGIIVTLNADTAAIRHLNIAGTLTVSGSNTLQIGGNFTNHGTFNPGSGTVEFTGSGSSLMTATAPGALTFYNLKVNKSAKTDTVTATSKLKVTRKLTVAKGKLVSASDYQDILIQADGTLELTSDITIAGDLRIESQGTLVTATHKVAFDGATVQNLSLAELVQFDDLTVSTGTTLIETDSANVTVQVSRISPRNTRNTQNSPGFGHEVPEAFSRIWRVWRAPLLNSYHGHCAGHYALEPW
jgi:hypothetical protein